MNILVYGAGKYCSLYLSNMKKNNDEILGIVDGNRNNWGSKKNGYIISSPDNIGSFQYDKVIVAIEKYETVVDGLLDRKIDKKKIFIYDGRSNKIIPFSSLYEHYLENKICRQNAIKQVKTGLLLESFQEGEYSEYERIIIVGDKNDFIFIKDFFLNINQSKISLVYGEDINDIKVGKLDKFIFCGKNYKNDLAKVRNRLISEKQWIVLPFFDIKNSIDL